MQRCLDSENGNMTFQSNTVKNQSIRPITAEPQLIPSISPYSNNTYKFLFNKELNNKPTSFINKKNG